MSLHTTVGASHGIAICKGISVGQGRNLTVNFWVGMQGTLGNLYVYGRVHGQQVKIQNIALYDPVWTEDAKVGKWVVVKGDWVYKQGERALLTVSFHLLPNGTGILAWHAQRYRSEDSPGEATGEIVLQSEGGGYVVTGQTVIEIPQEVAMQ